MNQIRCDINDVRFPARCVRCGRAPDVEVTLRAYSGLDLLVTRRGDNTEVVAPACSSCSETLSRNRAIWYTCAVFAGIGLAVLLAVINDALIGSYPGLRRFVGPLVLLSLGAFFLPVMWARNAGRRWYERRFTPIWLVSHEPSQHTVTIGAKDSALLDSIGQHSEHNDNPSSWVPQGEWHFPYWALLVLGVLFVAVGWSEYTMLAKAEEKRQIIRRIWLEIMIYKIGGKTAVLAFFLSFAGLVSGVGVWGMMKLRRKEE